MKNDQLQTMAVIGFIVACIAAVAFAWSNGWIELPYFLGDNPCGGKACGLKF